MAKLPQRTRDHTLETESRRFVENIFPPEWIVEDGQKDYGIDLNIEIVDKTNVTGAHFLMQLKSTDRIKKKKRDDSISCPCKTSTLRYFLQRSEPIIFLVYDAEHKRGYWIWIQPYIRNVLQKNKKWKNQTTATVKVPKANVFTNKSLDEIKSYVMRTHRQAKLLSTIQTLDNPFFEYGLKITEDKETITMFSKYPGAVEDSPLVFNLGFRFDESPDAQLAHQSLKDAIRKGQPTEIDGKFIANIDFPELADPEIFGYDFKLDKLFITPLSENRRFNAMVTILDDEDEALSQIPFVEFREKYYGTEEITFSNDEQLIPLKLSFRLRFVDRKANISFRFTLTGLNAFQAKQVLNFQKAFATGIWLDITDASTNKTLIKCNIPKNLISKPSSELLDIANKLAMIQEKTGEIVLWPQEISFDEKDIITEIISIVETGQSIKGKYFSFSFKKASAKELLESFSNGKAMNIRFEAGERFAYLFGQKISFGPVTIIAPGARPNQETMERFTTLDQLSDDASIEIELETGISNVTIYHHRWLSPEIKGYFDQRYGNLPPS